MKKRAKVFCVLIITLVMMTVMLSGCAKTDNSAKLASKGVAVTLLMDETAESETYRQMLSALGSLGELIENMGAGDYSVPDAIYAVEFDTDISNLSGNMDLSSLSDSVSNVIVKRMIASVPTRIAALCGSEALAATACIAASDTFECDALEKSMLYIYVYNECQYCSMVIFTPGDDGTVGVSAMFVPVDDTLQSAAGTSDITAWLMERVDLTVLSVENIQLP